MDMVTIWYEETEGVPLCRGCSDDVRKGGGKTTRGTSPPGQVECEYCHELIHGGG